jgi:hypothetical protein
MTAIGRVAERLKRCETLFLFCLFLLEKDQNKPGTECEVDLAVAQGSSRRGCKSFLGIFARKINRLSSRASPEMLLEEYLAGASSQSSLEK